MAEGIRGQVAGLLRPPIEEGESESRVGLIRGVAPFTIALVVGLLFVPLYNQPLGLLTLFGLATFGLVVLAAVLVPWQRLPEGSAAILPLTCIVVVGLLRHGEGGPGSGWAPLVFLPTLWVAFYGSRRELALALLFMAGVFVIPILAFGPPLYGPLEWRRSVLHLLVGGFLGYGVHYVMGQLRERARSAVTREQLLETILRMLPDLVTLRDAEGKLVMANRAAVQTAGLKQGETVDQVTLVDEDRDASRAFVRDVLAGEQGRTLTVRMVTPDGRVQLFNSRGTQIDIDGQPHGLFLSQNVTEQVQLLDELREAKERAEAADRAKSEFLSRMSHELRTPLNAIMGFGQLLELSRDISNEDRRSAQHVVRGGRHLLALINDILDVTNIEAGRFEISVEPVEVDAIIDESMALTEPLAASKSISVLRPAATGAYVKADRQRLRQALLNLLSNAVKYNRPGGRVWLEVMVGEDVSRISVRDEGRGIPTEMLGRLFQPFDRLGLESAGIEGTGLGLTLTKRLLEAMGGAIAVESEPGHGSTFTITLPTSRPGSAEPSGPAALEPQVGKGGGVRTLLYIEDNLVNVGLIEAIVEQQPGLRLIPALQGSLGLDLAREHLPDVILLDVHLPDMPGWDVLTQLKSTPETAAIPVVMVSADATERQMRRFLDAGAHDYLTKPVDVRRLLELLDELLPAVAGGEAGGAGGSGHRQRQPRGV